VEGLLIRSCWNFPLLRQRWDAAPAAGGNSALWSGRCARLARAVSEAGRRLPKRKFASHPEAALQARGRQSRADPI